MAAFCHGIISAVAKNNSQARVSMRSCALYFLAAQHYKLEQIETN